MDLQTPKPMPRAAVVSALFRTTFPQIAQLTTAGDKEILALKAHAIRDRNFTDVCRHIVVALMLCLVKLLSKLVGCLF